MSRHKLRDYFILTFEISGGNTVSLALSSLFLLFLPLSLITLSLLGILVKVDIK